VLAILALRKPRLVKLPVHQPDSPSTSITTPSETSTSNVLGFGTRPSEIQAAADLTQEEEIQDYEAPPSTSNPRPISHKLNSKNSKPKTVLKQSKVLYLDLDLHWGDGVVSYRRTKELSTWHTVHSDISPLHNRKKLCSIHLQS